MCSTQGVRDEDVIAAQIRRPLRAASRAASRCNQGLPIVVEVPPVLESGEPFPTRYWLTCPLAHKRIARLEAAGGVQAFTARAAAEPEFAEALGLAHEDYAAERDALVPDGTKIRPRGGVGGAAQGVKCLHAHFAHHSGGGTNPIGVEVAASIAPLECPTGCVHEVDGSVERNPGWREPRLER